MSTKAPTQERKVNEKLLPDAKDVKLPPKQHQQKLDPSSKESKDVKGNSGLDKKPDTTSSDSKDVKLPPKQHQQKLDPASKEKKEIKNTPPKDKEGEAEEEGEKRKVNEKLLPDSKDVKLPPKQHQQKLDPSSKQPNPKSKL
eukprot:TRINITY_DN1124_c0_g2_i2.p1 TRINITY_DN1124_c0_g2~~TRINITY_DN1124_c0_g2_i2.p1  ORF type:complete len:142 (-),score=69.78 TRINITY_DN1124_c0_g2_i2:177-602(-)